MVTTAYSISFVYPLPIKKVYNNQALLSQCFNFVHSKVGMWLATSINGQEFNDNAKFDSKVPVHKYLITKIA